MDIIFYSTTSANNVIGKVLNGVLTSSINLRSDFDISNPTLKISFPAGIDPLTINYCEIPELNRKYFVNEVSSINNKICQLDCSCDVIETYKNEILNSNASYSRKIKNGDTISPNVTANEKATVTTYESNGGFSGEPITIMTTLGGIEQ